MKRLFKFRYPKIVAFAISIIIAYFIFSNPIIKDSVSHLGTLSYVGVFIAGALFTLGFTSPFAAGFFITLNPLNILLSAAIGGLGALAGDMLIFYFIRVSFMDEFNRLKKTKLIRNIQKLIEKKLGHKIRIYLMYAFAGFLIASPLPDEAGVTMLAGLTTIKAFTLARISYILNSLGILILLII